MSSNFKMPKICEQCDNSFIAKTLNTKFCSHKCSAKNYKLRKRAETISNHIEQSKKSREQSNSPPDLTKEILTINETCLFLSLSRMTLHRLLKTGRLPSFKIGNRRLIHKEEILLMIKINQRHEIHNPAKNTSKRD